MRLNASGSKAEVRLGYLPTLHNRLVRPLLHDGSDAIPEVIEAIILDDGGCFKDFEMHVSDVMLELWSQCCYPITRGSEVFDVVDSWRSECHRRLIPST